MRGCLGPLFLTFVLLVLPQASLDVTETLSSRKYKDYPSYQQRVSRFVPLPPRPDGPLPPLPLADRLWMGWFVIGLAIAFCIDFEQVLIADPAGYAALRTKPAWPPPPCVAAIHWWGRHADPLVLARPTWYKVAIWLEILVQAPVYVLGLYAFARQRPWFRGPAVVYSLVLLTIMPIVLGEQLAGPHATPRPGLVLAVYAPWVVMPLLLLRRVFPPGGGPVFPAPTTTGGGSRGAAKTAGLRLLRMTPPARASRSPARPKRA